MWVNRDRMTDPKVWWAPDVGFEKARKEHIFLYNNINYKIDH